MKSSYVDIGGLKLHYLDHQGTGPTLVVSHGLTANARGFDGLASALDGRVRLVSVDLRGRGLSDKPATGYTMEDHASDMLGLFDYLGIERAHLGGHSFGGLLAMHTAFHHPERVSSCLVLDAPVDVDESILEQIQPALDRLGTEFASWSDYLSSIKAMPYYEGWWDTEIETYYYADVKALPNGCVRPRAHPEHIRQAVEGTLGIPWPDYLAGIDVPTLLIRAKGAFGPPGYPPILDSEQANRMLEQAKRGHLVELDGNHMTFLYGDSAALMPDEIVWFLTGGDT